MLIGGGDVVAPAPDVGTAAEQCSHGVVLASFRNAAVLHKSAQSEPFDSDARILVLQSSGTGVSSPSG